MSVPTTLPGHRCDDFAAARCLREREAQRSSGLDHRRPSRLDAAGSGEEAVEQARIAAVLHGNARVAHTIGVRLALVAQRIEARGRDERRRQPAHIAEER